jgi:hypothetical protein
MRVHPHPLERLAIRAFWLARLAHDAGMDGHRWQAILYKAARSCQPYSKVQGPGSTRLFGKPGAAGMSAEVDVALGDGSGFLALVEGKAYADYALGRDHVLVFDGKVRDYERRKGWEWNGTFALIASMGRLDDVTVHWCFACGIDIVDPDRMPLAVLARLPRIFPDVLERLSEPHLHEHLVDALAIESDELRVGPVLLRRQSRSKVLVAERLRDLNLIQSRLSEDLFHALTGADLGSPEAEAKSLKLRLVRDLKRVGLSVENDFDVASWDAAPG